MKVIGFSAAIASASLLAVSLPASASLEGIFSINPFVQGGQVGGVLLEGTGLTVPSNGGQTAGQQVPVTNIDFLPPSGPGNPSVPGSGAIIEVNGTDDFAQFQSWTGTILDLAVPSAACAVCVFNETNTALFPGSPVPQWIRIDTNQGSPGSPSSGGLGGFIANLDFLAGPEYTVGLTGTTVVIPTSITVFKLDTNGMITGDPSSSGIGTLSADFVGFTGPNAIANVQALFNSPGEMSGVVRPFSAQFIVVKEDVPEPASVLGLMMLGLGGVAAKALKSNKES